MAPSPWLLRLALVADVFVLAHAARIALDRAAPNELAVALFLHIADAGLVTPATAKEPAALDTVRRSVAESAACAKDAQALRWKGKQAGNKSSLTN